MNSASLRAETWRVRGRDIGPAALAVVLFVVVAVVGRCGACGAGGGRRRRVWAGEAATRGKARSAPLGALASKARHSRWLCSHVLRHDTLAPLPLPIDPRGTYELITLASTGHSRAGGVVAVATLTTRSARARAVYNLNNED